MKKYNKSGFTLIEILVVIAIIGLLATASIVYLTPALKKGRDSKRKTPRRYGVFSDFIFSLLIYRRTNCSNHGRLFFSSGKTLPKSESPAKSWANLAKAISPDFPKGKMFPKLPGATA